MKCFGTRATQNLAAHIESCVAPGAEQNERKLPGSHADSSESMQFYKYNNVFIYLEIKTHNSVVWPMKIRHAR